VRSITVGCVVALGVAATMLARCQTTSELAAAGRQSSAPAIPAGASSRAIELASWNLAWLNRRNERGPVARRPEDYARLARYAERLAADVIAVQEVDGAEALSRVFDPSTYAYHMARQKNAQLTGFAYKRTLRVTANPDLTSLNVGGVRVGADITLHENGVTLRLLSVHLKSACFSGPLERNQRGCVKLRAQLAPLEGWVDARARAHEAFVVLGDFNRRLNADDPFYRELDDSDPPESDLTLASGGQPSRCWGGRFPDLIDHLVFSKTAATWLRPGSFSQPDYFPADAPHAKRLSDHCPISVELVPGVSPPAK
jgi:endonuclease/exonuclease/phosphatase family metal-dependent hydrolase